MSEENTSAEQGAPTEQPVVVGFLGGFPPAPKTDEASVAPVEKPAEAAKPAEPPKTEEQPKLAELIRARREERQAREKAEQARAADVKQLEDAKAQLAKLQAADIETDPIGFAKAKGWTKETQLLVGQSLLYDLVPDKAPQDFRLKMFEQKQARKEAQEREAREQAAKQAETEAAAKTVNEYAQGLARASESFDAGTYPESEAWFADDHDTYARSLLATANNMAAAAVQAGRVADLSPAAVAAVLETEIAARMRRRDQSRAARPTEQAKPDQVEQKGQEARAGEKPAGSTTSTRGLGGGAPRRPAVTDQERVQRAIEAGWRTR